VKIVDTHPHPDENSEVLRLILPRLDRLRGLVAGKIPARFQSILSADDILQEVAMAAERTLGSLVDRDNERAIDRWLTHIAMSKTVDALRSVRALKRGGGIFIGEGRFMSFSNIFANAPSAQKPPSSDVRSAEAAQAVTKALEQLSPDRKQVVELRFIAGLSHADIAARMGKTEAAINSLLFHALRQLRMILGGPELYLSGTASYTGRSGGK
jgi:RNA polymerase sigma-70 factor (ECF subfamily)